MYCHVVVPCRGSDKTFKLVIFVSAKRVRSHGVMVSTLDFEFSDPSSNLGGTSEVFLLLICFIGKSETFGVTYMHC